ncbi:MAG: hypothetical protein IKQ29_02605 [Bacilli bacterium]|nr:hypothetical protein [Bacilli bacterium]
MKKRICIILGIILILFIVLMLLPDSFYKKHSKYGWFYENNFIGEPTYDETLEGWDLSIDDYFNKVLNNKYSYKYELDNIQGRLICAGRKDGDKEEGECTSPKEIKYTKENIKDAYVKYNTKYLDMSYVYDLIKDQDKDTTQMEDTRLFTYNLDKDETDIYIYCSKSNIKKIIIMNIYLSYVIEFSDIKE